MDKASVRFDDFRDSKIVIFGFAPGQKYGGAGVAIRRSDCKAVDVELGGVWSGE